MGHQMLQVEVKTAGAVAGAKIKGVNRLLLVGSLAVKAREAAEQKKK